MGAIVNAIVVIIAGGIGLFFNTGIPANVHERLMEAIGIAVLGIAVSGIIQGQNTLVMILSLFIGAIVGEWLDLDQRIIDFSNYVERKMGSKSKKNGKDWKQGFLTATMITCVGSLVIIGSLEAGLLGDNTTLYTKSIIDAITSFLLASSLGFGVLLSSIPVLIIEGGLTLGASLLEPLLAQEVISEVVCVGSIILIGLGLNILNVTKLKILNFTPAILMPIILMLFL